MNGIGTPRDRCDKPDKKSMAWFKKKCDCVLHDFSRRWLHATGDSFVVDAQEIYNPGGAANYVTKYITKAMEDWTAMEELGFTRRYSASRGFAPPRRRLNGTIDGIWKRAERVDRAMMNSSALPPADDIRFHPNDSLYQSKLGRMDLLKGVKKFVDENTKT